MLISNIMIKYPVFHLFAIILAPKLISAAYKCPKSEGRFKYGIGPSCNKFYECEKNIATIKTCPDNQGFQHEWKECVWKGFVRTCQTAGQAPICGMSPDKDQNDKRIENPWVVAIFQRDRTDTDWEYATPGVIIGPTAILTSCRLGREIHGKWRQSVNASSLQVIAGIDSVDLMNLDQFSQTMKISSIQLNQKSDKSHHSCYALIQLENPLEFNTSYVQPVCLPNLKPPVSSGSKGTFGYSGFGSITNYAEKSVGSDGFRHLNAMRMGLASQQYCFARTNLADNYCGKLRPGNVIGDLGDTSTAEAIACAQDDSYHAWYLLGLKTKCTSDVCSVRKLDDDPKLAWIMGSIRCGSKKYPCGNGGCIQMTSVCDSYRDCPDGEDEDPQLCRAMNPCINVATFPCGVYENCIKIEKVCDGFPDCLDASDEDPKICKSFKRRKTTHFNSSATPVPFPLDGNGSGSSVTSTTSMADCNTAMTSTERPYRINETFQTSSNIIPAIPALAKLIGVSATHEHTTTTPKPAMLTHGSAPAASSMPVSASVASATEQITEVSKSSGQVNPDPHIFEGIEE